MCLAGFGNSVLLGLEEGEHRIESVPGDYLGDGGGGFRKFTMRAGDTASTITSQHNRVHN